MAEEDFGIAIVEAQAAACPVIAYGKGGALETIIDGVTGILFPEQSVHSLIDAIMAFENRWMQFHPEDLIQNAGRFGKQHFIEKFRKFIEP
jgi:glycosyltransferase involved in cell wall biosynthesis